MNAKEMSDEAQNVEKFYTDAKEYWAQIPATVDGMLGGFSTISATDINGSRAFIRPFLTVSNKDIKNKTQLVYQNENNDIK